MVGVLLLLTALIIRPVLNSLLGGIILALIFHPIHRKLHHIIRNDTATALITTLLIVIITIVPLAFITKSIVGEASSIYQYSVSLKEISGCSDTTSMLCRFENWAKAVMSNSFVTATLGDFFSHQYK